MENMEQSTIDGLLDRLCELPDNARRLPLLAGYLLKEQVLEVLDRQVDFA